MSGWKVVPHATGLDNGPEWKVEGDLAYARFLDDVYGVMMNGLAYNRSI
jgi:hypothetical protein